MGDHGAMPSEPIRPGGPGWSSLAARLRWYELLPELAVVAGLTFFALDETDAATSAFGSSRAVTLMVLTAAVWIAARILTLVAVPWPWARAALFAGGGAIVLAVVVLPAYDDTTVIEAFPGAPVTTVAEPATTAAATADPPATTATTIATAATAATTPTEPVATTAPPTTAPATSPPEPQLLASGAIEGIDHRASGTATVYRAPDGSLVVGLEEIDIQPGPDYDVYVVPGADRDDVDGGVRLDDLRGNIGTQFYVVGPDVDLTDGAWTVLVWCQTFDVPVANATPTTV